MSVDVAGKSVLIVTSDPEKVIRLETLTQGARKVAIVDVDPDRVQRAAANADSLGRPVTFCCINIEEDVPADRFDVVMCLDVLQRVRNPMQTIDRLLGVCREQLVLDVPGPASQEAQEYLKAIAVPSWQRSRLARLPVIVVGRNGTTVTHPESKFYFSLAALRNLLVHHRRHFSDVQIDRIAAGRIRVVATRRP